MFMKRITYEYRHRIIQFIKFTFCPKLRKQHERVLAEAEEMAETALGKARFAMFEQACKERERQAPKLIFEETAVFISTREKPELHFYNVRKYRKRIREQFKFLRESGANTFIVEYSSPYGLLAMEMLLGMEQDHEPFRLFCFKRLGKKRQTYRLVKEYPLELVYLAARCDYSYGLLSRCEMFDLLHEANYLANESSVYSQKDVFRACVSE